MPEIRTSNHPNHLTMLFAACSVVFSACMNESANHQGEEKITLVATTGMIGDALTNVAGEYADVKVLIGPGVDPHLYKASHGDLRKLTSADVVFYNGLHLEGKMGEVLQKLSKRIPTTAVADGIPDSLLRTPPGFSGAHDPHIWFDIRRWSLAVSEIESSLCRHFPDKCAAFRANGKSYREKLDSLDRASRVELNRIPASKRVLITAHDAFGYFGESYGLEVRGLQGISTLSDYGLRDVTGLVDFIVERRIPALFAETSVSPRAIRAVQEGCRKKGWPLKLGGALYSDAMGAKGTPEGTYVGMFAANIKTITAALINSSSSNP